MSAEAVDTRYDCGCRTGRNVVSGRAFVIHCGRHSDPWDDPQTRGEVLDILRGLANGGRLWFTHDMVAAKVLESRMNGWRERATAVLAKVDT